MLGNEYLFELCKKDYPGLNSDNISYKIETLGNIEKTSIFFGEYCPIYCLCDGNYMHWYGDHGAFSFDCTWKTSVKNLPFNSPSYMFEKLDVTSIHGGAGKEFDSDICKKEVLDYLYESGWWEDLSNYDKSRIKGYITTDKYYPDIADYKISNNVNPYLVEEIRELVSATVDRFDFICKLRELDRSDTPFECCESLYKAGERISPHFYLIFYLLSVVVDLESKRVERLAE